jgi:protocatechuate 3,4-dioxygenase beta subunit
MKNLVSIICLTIICQFSILSACSQSYHKKIQLFEKTFLAKQTDYQNYHNLSQLVSEHYTQLNYQERKEIRDFLSDHAHFSTIQIPPAKETGQLITIKGTVKNIKGNVLPNMKLFIFHTDSKGFYAPTDSITKKMSETDPRLFGFVTTDKYGQYSFTTIHPGTYPFKYEGRYVPQHIHIQIVEKGFEPYAIQMIFENDPAMKERYWKDWAVKLKFPVVKLVQSGNRSIGNCDILLLNQKL